MSKQGTTGRYRVRTSRQAGPKMYVKDPYTGTMTKHHHLAWQFPTFVQAEMFVKAQQFPAAYVVTVAYERRAA